jgi:hypothetical protein
MSGAACAKKKRKGGREGRGKKVCALNIAFHEMTCCSNFKYWPYINKCSNENFFKNK